MSYAQEVKQKILEEDKLEYILEEIGMHHIKWHSMDSYITCGMPDGDNPSSTTIYVNEMLNVVAYTRDIVDKYRISDIISLICFVKKAGFRQVLMWLSGVVGLSEKHYIDSQDFSEDIFKKLKKLYESKRESKEPITILDEHILDYYYKWSCQDFVDDNISDQTQYEFEIGYDTLVDWTGYPRHRITIPIRDETGALVGIKGRLPKNVEFNGRNIDKQREENEPKYIYLYPCPKSQILYGLDKTAKYIEEQKEVIVCEAEKGVMQLWTYRYKNAVGIGGHDLSLTQIKKLLPLNADIVIAFDKDVQEIEILKECKKLIHSRSKIYYIIDSENILDEKQSPMDNPDKWEKLYNNKILFEYNLS